MSSKNPFNNQNLYSIYKTEDIPEWITFTSKKNIENDFTISSWVYITGAYYTYSFFQAANGNLDWFLVDNSIHSTTSISNNEDYLKLDSLSLNKWVYITCVNHNNQLTVYYDGKKQGSIKNNKNNLELNKGGYLFSYNNNDIYKRGMYGYIFDFFISDKAIWLQDFKPPIKPFEEVSNIYLDKIKNIWGYDEMNNNNFQKLSDHKWDEINKEEKLTLLEQTTNLNFIIEQLKTLEQPIRVISKSEL